MKKYTKIFIGILSTVIIICVVAVLLFMSKAEGKSDYEKHLKYFPSLGMDIRALEI